MASVTMLADVKKALGIEGTYQDDTLTVYIDTVVDYLIGAGVKESNIKPALVARGVSDIWTYNTGTASFSSAFVMMATQAALRS